MDSALAYAAHMNRFGAVQFLANKGATVMSIAADETQYNAIEAAKNCSQIQQWLRDFYQDANSAVDEYVAENHHTTLAPTSRGS